MKVFVVYSFILHDKDLPLGWMKLQEKRNKNVRGLMLAWSHFIDSYAFELSLDIMKIHLKYFNKDFSSWFKRTTTKNKKQEAMATNLESE